MRAPRTQKPVVPLTEAQAQLAADHMRFADVMVGRWFCSFAGYLDRQEMTSVAYEALCTAARGFDASRGIPFSLFAARCIKNKLISTCNVEDTVNRHVAPTDDIEKYVSAQGGPASQDLSIVLHDEITRLPERSQQVFKDFYFKGMTAQEVADKDGSTAKAILGLLYRTRMEIRKNMS